MGDIWTDYIGEYNAETKTFSALAGEGITGGVFTPKKAARLKRIILVAGGDAASTLMEHVQIKITSTNFAGVDVLVGISDTGLRTAPAFRTPPSVWAQDLDVEAGVPWNVSGKNITADTPVGVSVHVYAVFEAN